MICYYDFYMFQSIESLSDGERQCVQNAFSAKSASSVTERNDSNGQPIRIDESGRISGAAATENAGGAAGTDKNSLKRDCGKRTKRVAELDRLFEKLYENYALEKSRRNGSMRCLPSMKANRHSLKKRFWMNSVSWMKFNPAKIRLNGLWRLLSATVTVEWNIPMKCCVPIRGKSQCPAKP